jgi:hypothetical protein
MKPFEFDTVLLLGLFFAGLLGAGLGVLVSHLVAKRVGRHRLLTCRACGGRGLISSNKRGERNKAGACAMCGGHGVVHS